MSEKIYVVMGATGEYSDRIEWPVVAYRKQEQAETHVTLATAWKRSGAPGNPYDPSGITHADYYVMDVDIADSVPSVEIKG